MSAQVLSDALWAALAAGLLGLIAASHLRRVRLARVSVLLRRAVAHRGLFVSLLLGWMWLGWHFFAR